MTGSRSTKSAIKDLRAMRPAQHDEPFERDVRPLGCIGQHLLTHVHRISATPAGDPLLRGLGCRVLVHVGADVATDVGPKGLGTIEVQSKMHCALPLEHRGNGRSIAPSSSRCQLRTFAHRMASFRLIRTTYDGCGPCCGRSARQHASASQDAFDGRDVVLGHIGVREDVASVPVDGHAQPANRAGRVLARGTNRVSIPPPRLRLPASRESSRRGFGGKSRDARNDSARQSGARAPARSRGFSVTVARVFLDTSVIRHSIPRARAGDPGLQQEIDLLPQIAAMARSKVLELLWHRESRVEFISMAKLGAPKSVLLDAGVTFVPSPIKYARTITPISLLSADWKGEQVQFLAKLRDWPRYLEIQRACGAIPGTKRYGSQLIDAFHLWCAESASLHIS